MKKSLYLLIISCLFCQQGVLVAQQEEEKVEILHRGISKRYFERHFTIADDVKVNGAELKNGLLIVSLERIVPEQKKPRTIKIN